MGTKVLQKKNILPSPIPPPPPFLQTLQPYRESKPVQPKKFVEEKEDLFQAIVNGLKKFAEKMNGEWDDESDSNFN